MAFEQLACSTGRPEATSGRPFSCAEIQFRAFNMSTAVFTCSFSVPGREQHFGLAVRITPYGTTARCLQDQRARLIAPQQRAVLIVTTSRMALALRSATVVVILSVMRESRFESSLMCMLCGIGRI